MTTTNNDKTVFQRFSSNSEAFASELLENLWETVYSEQHPYSDNHTIICHPSREGWLFVTGLVVPSITL